MSDWNSGIIEEFRANEGKVGGPFEGAPLVLLHTTGAKTGEERINPLMYLPDGDRYVVFASKGGHDYHPHWMLNIEANPDVELEIGDRALQGQGRGAARRSRAGPALRGAGQPLPAVRRVREEGRPHDPGGRHRALA